MSKYFRNTIFLIILSFSLLLISNHKSYADICGCTGDAHWCYRCEDKQYPPNTTRDCPDCDWCSADNGWVYTCCNYTEWDSDGCSCTSGCTPPSCGSSYSTDNQNFGSFKKSCTDDCGDTESRTCYCYGCTLPVCPEPLSPTPTVVSPNMVLTGFRSCTNDCTVTTTADCYEVPTAQPTEVLIVNKNNPPDDQPNIFDFDSSTHSGRANSFTIGTYSAGNLNDPVEMIAKYTDTDGANDIEAAFVWFRLSTSTGEPGTPLYISTTAVGKAPATNSWGFMMHLENGKWYPYIPSYPTSGTATWTKVSGYNPDALDKRFSILGTDSLPMVLVSIKSVTVDTPSQAVTVTFSLNFSDPSLTTANKVSETKYKVLLMGLDKFSFTPSDNYSFSVSSYWQTNQLRYRSTPTVAQTYARDWFDTSIAWNIDKTPPTILLKAGYPNITGSKINISWDASDTQNLYSVIGNVYSTAGADIRPVYITTTTPSGMTVNSTFSPIVSSSMTSTIARLNGNWGFRVNPNINSTVMSNNVSIDIGDNRKGVLEIYITVFDDAGNMAQTTVIQDLNDWFVTDGGLAYSKGGTNFQTKQVTTSWNDGTNKILPPFTITANESLRNTMADYSSEMWGELNTTSQVPQSLLRSLVSKSFNLRDFPSTTLSSYYTTLMEAYIQKRSSIPLASFKEISIAGDVTVANANLTAIFTPMKTYNVALITGKLVVDRLNCNGNSLIFVNGDIDVLPNISNQFPDRNACIFVSSGNINIYEGVNNSNGGKFGYDQVNGFFFADGIITIRHETSKAPDSIIDGIYLNGGIEAMTNIKIERYLRLIERLSYPVLAIDAHPKYGVLGGIYFANNFIFQKVETGFKPL